MKRTYVTPEFYAESYHVTSSIASCEQHVGNPDTHTPIRFEYGKHSCSKPNCGHINGTGAIPGTAFPITVFNDGPTGRDDSKCQYDWAGGSVTGPKNEPYTSLGKALFGAKANNSNHLPTYNGGVLFS